MLMNKFYHDDEEDEDYDDIFEEASNLTIL